MNLTFIGKIKCFVLCALTLSLWITDSAQARIISSVSLQRLTIESEVVVKGRVFAIENSTVGNQIVTIEVDKIIKGKWENKPVVFKLPEVPFPLLNRLMIGEYCLFFLREENGMVKPTDPFHIALPVREGMLPNNLPIENVLAAVQEEMLFTAQGPSVLSKDDQNKEKLQIDTSRKLNRAGLAYVYPVFPMNVMAVQYLAEPTYDEYQHVIPSQGHVVEALRNMLPTEDVLLRGALFSTLLTLGQFDMLDPAIKYIDRQERISGESNRAQVARLADDIASAISLVSDEKYTTLLGRLLKHRDVRVRRSAVYALRTISDDVHLFNLTIRYPESKRDDKVKTPEEIKVLRAKLAPLFITALDDEDQLVRKGAIHGIGGLFVDSPLPSEFLGALESLPKEEVDQQLIVQWKRWWQNQGRNEFEL